MPITLQSTVGGFSAEFMRKLPAVEQAMIAVGLEPSEFVISKDYATPASVPFIGPFFYDHSVFFGDEHFTVTEPNDMVFLDYFYKRCIAADDPTQIAAPPRNGTLPQGRRGGVIDFDRLGFHRSIWLKPSQQSRLGRPIPPTPAPWSQACSPRSSARP